MKRSLDDLMKITDQLAIQALTQIENPNYLGINAMIYSYYDYYQRTPQQFKQELYQEYP